MILRRALLTTATTAGIIAAGAGVASAAPVLDPAGTPYCGPGQEWIHDHCESTQLQVDPGQQQSDDRGWFVAVIPAVALLALL